MEIPEHGDHCGAFTGHLHLPPILCHTHFVPRSRTPAWPATDVRCGQSRNGWGGFPTLGSAPPASPHRQLCRRQPDPRPLARPFAVVAQPARGPGAGVVRAHPRRQAGGRQPPVPVPPVLPAGPPPPAELPEVWRPPASWQGCGGGQNAMAGNSSRRNGAGLGRRLCHPGGGEFAETGWRIFTFWTDLRPCEPTPIPR